VTVQGMHKANVSFDVYFGHPHLYFLVENTGRINYGSEIGDRKVAFLSAFVQYLMFLVLLLY
jgi:hypothetical protein